MKPLTSIPSSNPTPTPSVVPTPKVIPTSRSQQRSRVRRGNDSEATNVSIMLFGSPGTGKTYAVADLLRLGSRVLVLSTDIGVSGLMSVKIALRREGKQHLLENLVEVPLYNYREVVDFLDKPSKFFPEIYEFDPDWVVWDTFSSFQQLDLSEMVGESSAETSDRISEAQSAGFQHTQQGWGILRNATVHFIDRFLSLKNEKTDRSWYKLVTCHEGIRQVAGQSGVFQERREPMLQGAGGKIVLGAFDLIIRTAAVKNSNASGVENEESSTRYLYYVDPGLTSATKNRGIIFPDKDGKHQSVFPGSFAYVWKQFSEQTGCEPRIRQV